MTGTYPEPDGLQTGGHAGGATSEERARREAQDGTLTGRLSGVREIAWSMGLTGVTVAEVRHTLRLHHGQASSALTNLHRRGALARLAKRRNGCFIYVTPDYVAGRETHPPGRTRSTVVDREPLSADERALVDRVEAEAGNDPSGLALVESPDLFRLVEIIRSRS